MSKSLFKTIQVFQFGKYKDKPILEVCQNDPNYIDWILKNVKGYKTDKKILRTLRVMLQMTNEEKLYKEIQEDKILVNN